VATLTDTNILLRSLNPNDPQYGVVKNALSTFRLRNEVLSIAPQNLIEFWAVATRTVKENGLGLTTAEAESEIAGIRRFFRLQRPRYWKCGSDSSSCMVFRESKRMMPIWWRS
jgi:hypothetical protein